MIPNVVFEKWLLDQQQIEVVDSARHLGEEYPSVDVQRRYGRT